MEGDFSADVRRHLQAGLRNWRDCGGIVPLPLCLGLPGTPRRTAELARDAWLREAAATLTTATPWQLARALETAVRAFLLNRWPQWEHAAEPPDHDVRPIEIALFHGAKAAELPEAHDTCIESSTESDTFRETVSPDMDSRDMSRPRMFESHLQLIEGRRWATWMS